MGRDEGIGKGQFRSRICDVADDRDDRLVLARVAYLDYTLILGRKHARVLPLFALQVGPGRAVLGHENPARPVFSRVGVVLVALESYERYRPSTEGVIKSVEAMAEVVHTES